MTGVKVTVVFALPDSATQIDVVVPTGSTVAEAVDRSGLAAANPNIDFATLRLGIWGRFAEPSTTLVNGDRVEVYRPLVADPKRDRRHRARKQHRT